MQRELEGLYSTDCLDLSFPPHSGGCAPIINCQLSIINFPWLVVPPHRGSLSLPSAPLLSAFRLIA